MASSPGLPRPLPTLPRLQGRVGRGRGTAPAGNKPGYDQVGLPRVLPLLQMFASKAQRCWRWPAASCESRSSSNRNSVNANLLWTVRGRDK